MAFNISSGIAALSSSLALAAAYVAARPSPISGAATSAEQTAASTQKTQAQLGLAAGIASLVGGLFGGASETLKADEISPPATSLGVSPRAGFFTTQNMVLVAAGLIVAVLAVKVL